MNAKLQRLRSEITSDFAAFQKQVDDMANIRPTEHSDPRDLAYVAWCLHHAYTALEAIFERVARALEGGLPDAADWHRQLLDGAFREIEGIRPAILGASAAEPLADLRAFRHRIRHAYDADLHAGRLAIVQQGLLSAREQIAADVTTFCGWLDATARNS